MVHGHGPWYVVHVPWSVVIKCCWITLQHQERFHCVQFVFNTWSICVQFQNLRVQFVSNSCSIWIQSENRCTLSICAEFVPAVHAVPAALALPAVPDVPAVPIVGYL